MNTCIQRMLATTLFLTVSLPTRADYRLDYYEVSVIRGEHKTHYLDEIAPTVLRKNVKRLWTDENNKSLGLPYTIPVPEDGRGAFMQLNGASLNYAGASTTFPADSVTCTVHVTPHFKWHGQESDVKPARLLVAERSYMYLPRYHSPDGRIGNVYAQNPQGYMGDGFELTVDNGFKDDLVFIGNVNPHDGGTTSVYRYSQVIDGRHLTNFETGMNMTFPGETRKLSYTISAPGGWTFPVAYDNYLPKSSVSSMMIYEAAPAIISIKLRRKATNGDFLPYTTLAAGAKSNDEHVADAIVQARAMFWSVNSWATSPVSNADFSQKIYAVNGSGFKTPEGDAALGGLLGPYIPEIGHKTDAQGSVLVGTIRSSDKLIPGPQLDKDGNQLTPDKRVHLAVETGGGTKTDPKALVDQVWGHTEWRMGEHGELSFGQPFQANADTVQWVWTKLLVHGDKPLKDHTVRIKPARVVLRVWEPSLRNLKTLVFSTDPNEPVPPGCEDNNDCPVLSPDIRQAVAQYITVPDVLAGDSQGVYKGQVTIKSGDDFLVESYQLMIEDDDVFEKQN